MLRPYALPRRTQCLLLLQRACRAKRCPARCPRGRGRSTRPRRRGRRSWATAAELGWQEAKYGAAALGAWCALGARCASPLFLLALPPHQTRPPRSARRGAVARPSPGPLQSAPETEAAHGVALTRTHHRRSPECCPRGIRPVPTAAPAHVGWLRHVGSRPAVLWCRRAPSPPRQSETHGHE